MFEATNARCQHVNMVVAPLVYPFDIANEIHSIFTAVI